MPNNITDRLNQLVDNSLYKSRRALASAAGIPQVTFNDNIRGTSEPRFSTLAAILSALPNVSAEWLMRGTGEMFLSENKEGGEKPSSNKLKGVINQNNVSGDNNISSDISDLFTQLKEELTELREEVKQNGGQNTELTDQLKTENARLAELLKSKENQIDVLLALLTEKK